MDVHHKEILETYRNLLTRNLILTDDFYRALVTHNVFPDQMIKEIKVCSAKTSSSAAITLGEGHRERW